jgi:hypothetical protein
MEVGALILVVVAALFGVSLLIGALVCTVFGAIILFELAAEQGFLGLAAYFACWVFLFPVMLIASLIIGLVIAIKTGKPIGTNEYKLTKNERLARKLRARLGYDN